MGPETTKRLRRRQKSAVLTGIQVFQLILLLLQLYLFVSALEASLGGHYSSVLPTAGFSVALFIVNLWMTIGVNRLDKLS